MYSVKKIFGVMLLLACFILPQTVSAEKNDWKDNNYNFRGVRQVLLKDISSNINFHNRGNIFIQKLRSTYQSSAKKLKCAVMTEDDARQMGGVADLYIECEIKDWSDDYYIVPERTVWERKKMYRTVRDRNGNRYEEEYYVEVPVTYPPRRVDISKIAVSFEVYDAQTGRLVFGREDVRDREDRNAQDGMYGRICNSFFQDLGKLIK